MVVLTSPCLLSRYGYSALFAEVENQYGIALRAHRQHTSHVYPKPACASALGVEQLGGLNWTLHT